MSREKAEKALVKFKRYAWMSGICGTMMLTVGIVIPIVLMNYIIDQAKQQVVMTSDNQRQWGEVPGETGLVIERQFTFYNWTNPEEFFVLGQTPLLYETEKVYYQEYQNFLDPDFSDDQTTVNFNFYQYFMTINGTTGNETATVVNLGPLGFWYQVKQASFVQIGIQTFYGLFSGMVTGMFPYGVYGGALTSKFIKTQDDFNKLCAGILSMEAIQVDLYTDPMYGIEENNPLWFAAYTESLDATQNSANCQLLIQYFKIDFTSLNQFFTNAATSFKNAKTGGNLAVAGFGCIVNNGITQQCIAATQWCTLKVLSQASVSAGNSTTANTFPEIKFYITSDDFKSQVGDPTPYTNIAFPQKWGQVVMNYITNPKSNTEFVQTTSTLLNVANLEYLYIEGVSYDQTQDEQHLINIANRFLITTDSAFTETDAVLARKVFWYYCKYMVNQFAEFKYLLKNPADGPSIAGLGGVGSQSLYGIYSGSVQILSNLVYGGTLLAVGSQFKIKTCQNLATLTQLTGICYEGSPVDDNPNGGWYINQWMFIYECSIYGAQLQVCKDFNTNSKIPTAIATIIANPTVTEIIKAASDAIYAKYGNVNGIQYCSTTIKRCSYFELANMQWSDSIITLNPLSDTFPKSYSLYDWFPTQLPNHYEWGYYKNKYVTNPQTLTAQQINQLLSFNALFNGSAISKIFALNVPDGDPDFITNYIFEKPEQLRNYLRFVIAMVGFQLTQTRQNYELLFGYDDPFLLNMAEENPQEGGDPSTGYNLAFNEPNMTNPSQYQSQAMNTGYSNVNSVRQYVQVNGLPYTTMEFSEFEGTLPVVTSFVTPWADEVAIVGTDAGSNRPDIGSDTPLSIFITTLYTGGFISPTGTTSMVHGLNTQRYQPSGCFLRNQTVCPSNAQFYSYTYDVSINLTSILQGPVFNTKTHMYQMEPPMYERVTVINIDGNVQGPSEWDETYMSVEPISGVSLQIVLNLQGVMLFEPDLLFSSLTQPVMIPFFYVYRSGNLTESQVNSVLGSLKDGLLIKELILYIGCASGGLLLLGFAYTIFAIVKLKKALANELLEEGKDETQEKLRQADEYI